jgi:predicted DNA repair protein MutK
MVISLKEVLEESFIQRTVVLIVVAVLITLVVYGVVALIVRMDDAGLALAEQESASSQRIGRLLVSAMPKVLTFLSVIGTAAMLWVGGHIILAGSDELGWPTLYDLVHRAEESVHGVAGVGGILSWLVNTGLSAVLGLIVGAIVVAVVSVLPFGPDDGDEHGATASHA